MGRTSDARERLIEAANDLIWEYSYGAITIDAICERAVVKKGSFYYFFDSKSELAVVAIGEWWKARQAVLDRIFTPETAPLERICQFLEWASATQLANYEETGQVLGCALFSLGPEISTQDEKLRCAIAKIIASHNTYFIAALNDAQTLGQIAPGDTRHKADILTRYYAGMFMQARIENNPEPIRHLATDILALLDAKTPVRALETPLAMITPAAPPAELARS